MVSKGLLTKGKVLTNCKEISGNSGKENFCGLVTKGSGQIDFLIGSYTITFEPDENKLLQENVYFNYTKFKFICTQICG